MRQNIQQELTGSAGDEVMDELNHFFVMTGGKVSERSKTPSLHVDPHIQGIFVLHGKLPENIDLVITDGRPRK